MEKIINWFVKSSANPQQLALTVKGGVAYILSVLIPILSLGFGIDISENSDNIIEQIGYITTAIAQFISALVAFFGFVRKIYNTYKNKYR